MLIRRNQTPYKKNIIDPRIALFMPGGKIAVDLGCGTGYALGELGKLYKISVGLDVNISRLKQYTTPTDGCYFVCADLNQGFPLNNNYVDIVFVNQVIEHIGDPNYFAKEAYRVLRIGGIAIVTTPNIRYVKHLWRLIVQGFGPKTAKFSTQNNAWDDGHIHYFTHRDLLKVFMNVGFSQVVSRALIDLDKSMRWLRALLDYFSAALPIREFLSGNILLVATK